MVTDRQIPPELQAALNRQRHEIEALYYVNHPAHAITLLEQLVKQLQSFLTSASDDPLLVGLDICDQGPSWAGILTRVLQWAMAVKDADSPDLPHTGAR